MKKLLRVHWVATGGTIAGKGVSGKTAGYKAGDLSVDDLLNETPILKKAAKWTFEQVFNIGSQHVTQAHWQQLIQAVTTALKSPSIDAVLVTHGTDTLEETAFLLHVMLPALGAKHGKPVILTAAMRPSTALSADGPGNIADALCFAKYLHEQGQRHTQQAVWVIMQNKAYSPIGFYKHAALGSDAFAGNEFAAIILDSQVLLRFVPTYPCWTPGCFSSLHLPTTHWPEVLLAYLHADMNPQRFEAMLRPYPSGLVLACLGHRSIPDYLQPCLLELMESGVPIVKASRTVNGPVFDLKEGKISNAWAAGFLTPPQARLALQLCLLAQQEWPDSEGLEE